MHSKDNFSNLPVVTDWIPTKCGRGRCFFLTPGKRIELDKYDQWEPHEGESIFAQLRRVSHLPKEVARREKHALRLREVRIRSPLYQQKDAAGGMVYWRALADSALLAD